MDWNNTPGVDEIIDIEIPKKEEPKAPEPEEPAKEPDPPKPAEQPPIPSATLPTHSPVVMIEPPSYRKYWLIGLCLVALLAIILMVDVVWSNMNVGSGKLAGNVTVENTFNAPPVNVTSITANDYLIANNITVNVQIPDELTKAIIKALNSTAQSNGSNSS